MASSKRSSRSNKSSKSGKSSKSHKNPKTPGPNSQNNTPATLEDIQSRTSKKRSVNQVDDPTENDRRKSFLMTAAPPLKQTNTFLPTPQDTPDCAQREDVDMAPIGNKPKKADTRNTKGQRANEDKRDKGKRPANDPKTSAAHNNPDTQEIHNTDSEPESTAERPNRSSPDALPRNTNGHIFSSSNLFTFSHPLPHPQTPMNVEPPSQRREQDEERTPTANRFTPTVNEDGTITTINGFKYTAPPAGGFKAPAIGRPVSQFIDRTQWTKWTNYAQYKVWVRLWRARWIENKTIEHRDTVLNVLGTFLGRRNIKLSDPIPSNNTDRKRFDPPWNFLAYNLTQEEYNRVINTPIIASHPGTILIMPFHQPIPHFLTTISNTSCRNDEEGLETMHNTVITTLRNSTEITNFITTKAGPGAYEEMIKGIEVKCLENPGTQGHQTRTWWNVYSASNPNFIDFADYTNLQNLLSQTPFRTDDNGVGHANILFECANCKSIDHPVSLCPYYNTPGWLGPTREEDLSRGRQQNGENHENNNDTQASRGNGNGYNNGNRNGNNNGYNRRGRGGRGGNNNQNTNHRNNNNNRFYN